MRLESTSTKALRACIAGAAVSLALAASAQVPGEKAVGGIVFRIGLARAEQIHSGHPEGHEERSMHQPSAARERDHLVVSLADQRTGKLIDDAAVNVSISRMGTDHVSRKLERMQTGGMVSYGDYFDLSAPGPYVIRVEVRRPGTTTPAMAQFDYRNR